MNDYPLLLTIAKSGFTLEVGPLPWGSAVGSLYLKTKLIVWQLLDAVESRNRIIKTNRSNDNIFDKNDFEVISSSTTFYQSSECNPINYPTYHKQDVQNNLFNIAAMIHPEFQGKDYSQELTKETRIFIGLDGSTEYKFDPESMTQGEDEDVRREKSFYPFFINESAYYEKRIAFCIAFKTQKQVLVSIRKQ